MPLSQTELDALISASRAAVAAVGKVDSLIGALVADKPLPLPTINNMTATPASLPVGGGSVTINAVVTDATSMTLDGQPIAGLPRIMSVTANHTYTLIATNATGSSAPATASVTVAVAKPTITNMTVTPASLPAGGGNVVVDAQITGADTVTLSIDAGPPQPVTLPVTVALT